MSLETKQNGKTRFSPQISGVMISFQNMVSPQNDVTQGELPPSDGTGYFYLATWLPLQLV